jgi:hypothetical protein
VAAVARPEFGVAGVGRVSAAGSGTSSIVLFNVTLWCLEMIVVKNLTLMSPLLKTTPNPDRSRPT